MAFNFQRGAQVIDDLVAQSDPERNTKIDFGNDIINIVVSGTTIATFNNTSISSSLDLIAARDLKSNFSSGDEGGQIFLNKPVTNTNITGGINIDVYQNRVRIFEEGGLNRGVFIDIPTITDGVATNLSPAGALLSPYLFGDGSDGNATLDGTGSVAWATRSGAIYTMTRDALCKDITINSGITLRPNNFFPCAAGTLTNNGTIETIGNNAAGAVPGAIVANTGTWYSSGGNGGSGSINANGIIGGGSGGASIGGGGGKGGDAGAFTGGVGNASALLNTGHGSYRTIGFLINRRLFSGYNWTSLNGSGGGGGGAGSNGGGTGTGGGGGSAAGLCAVAANILINNGTIQSVGGKGADGVISGGGTPAAGGGGGGSGGPVFIWTNYLKTAGTIQSVGGSAGAGAGGGGGGAAGSANLVIIIKGAG